MAEEAHAHVVALAFLTQGHVGPLMHLCLQLASRGIKVTFVHVRPVKEANQQFENLNFHKLEVPPLQKLFHTSDPDAFAKHFDNLEKLSTPFEELLQGLDPKPGCIISDCMYGWTQKSAKKFGIPRVGLWTTSLASLCVDFHIPQMIVDAYIPVDDWNRDRLVTNVPGLNPLKAFDLPVMYHASNIMTQSDPGYVRKIARSLIVKDDDWLFINSFEELEPLAFQEFRAKVNKNCLGIAPMIPAKLFNQESTPIAASKEIVWLNSKELPRSVVYVSFGSAVSLSKTEFQQLSKGLEESGVAFLWALRPGGVEQVDEDDPMLVSFKERSANNGSLVVTWVSQMEVLCHASVGAFVTHCGWNSVLESICGGVPMLGLPKQAEQNFNCKVVAEDMKIGTRLQLVQDSTTVATTVTSILQDAEMRERVQLLRCAAHRSAAKAETAVEIVRKLVQK